MKASVFKAADVEAAVAAAHGAGQSGATLVAKDAGLGYGLILTHFKDRQPKPELHEAADDVYYIIAGAATLWLGGEIADRTEKGAGEWTGRTIDGAETIEVGPGDAVHVPRGTPHMMGCPGGELRYFVVKVWS